jgi:DNA-binding NarL/FixJ family response regulator
VVILELDATAWDPCRLVTSLRKRQRSLVVVGLGEPDRLRAERAQRAGVNITISVDVRVDELMQAVRTGSSRTPIMRLPVAEVPAGRQEEGLTTLTERQLEVLRLVGAGYTSRQIGEALGISAKTVENHKRQVFRRLGVQNQSHAVSIAMRRGLIGPGVGISRGAVAWPSS